MLELLQQLHYAPMHLIFQMTEKIARIQESVKDILITLGMDLEDDSLRGTPKRVAKSFVNELFMGLNPANKPSASTFENNYNYGEMLVEKNIVCYSTCEHHLLTYCWKSSCCLYFRRKSYWFV